eukprot:4694709-Alexandrium_andersonii.AAC.1
MAVATPILIASLAVATALASCTVRPSCFLQRLAVATALVSCTVRRLLPPLLLTLFGGRYR